MQETKPAPDLVSAAIEKAGGGAAVMVGDSTWDCEAARREGVDTIGVLTGGFSDQELLEAGAGACSSGSTISSAGSTRPRCRPFESVR